MSSWTLTCNNGTIGGWEITRYGIRNGNTRLYNGVIQTNQVDIYMGNSWSTYLGYLGYVPGADDVGVTDNIGIRTTGSGQSIILDSARNIALNTDGAGGIWVNANQFHMNVPQSGQSGIYAQFA